MKEIYMISPKFGLELENQFILFKKDNDYIAKGRYKSPFEREKFDDIIDKLNFEDIEECKKLEFQVDECLTNSEIEIIKKTFSKDFRSFLYSRINRKCYCQSCLKPNKANYDEDDERYILNVYALDENNIYCLQKDTNILLKTFDDGEITVIGRICNNKIYKLNDENIKFCEKLDLRIIEYIESYEIQHIERILSIIN